MANEGVVSMGPDGGWSEKNGNPTGGGTQPFTLVPVGSVPANTGNGCLAGAGFAAGVTGTMLYLFRVPNAATLATGLTFHITLTDDPLGPPSAVSLNSYWGVTVAPLTSGTSTPDETVFASSTEDKYAITHGATIGTIIFGDHTAVVGHMNSLAAGNLAMIRLRRLGANVLDTNTNGRAVLLRFDVRNT